MQIKVSVQVEGDCPVEVSRDGEADARLVRPGQCVTLVVTDSTELIHVVAVDEAPIAPQPPQAAVQQKNLQANDSVMDVRPSDVTNL